MPIAKESSNFTPAPAGTHIARCYGCISLGTQHSEMFADAYKVMLLFELPHEMLDGKEGEAMPMTVSKEYTLSLNKKANLRKHLDTWRGRAFTEEELKGFEVSKVVGAPCQITITHKQSGTGSTYAAIESITGLAKGMTCPAQFHTSIIYEIEMKQNDVFDSLPEWIRKKIQACEEWKTPTDQSSTQPTGDTGSVDDDDVPF